MNTWQLFLECPSKFPLLSLTMDFYSRTQGKKCIKIVDSRGQTEPLHRHPVILNFVPDYTLLMQFTTDFRCPFQLTYPTLNLSFKEIKLIGKVPLFFAFPKEFFEQIVFNVVFPPGFVFTSVNPRGMAATFVEHFFAQELSAAVLHLSMQD